MPDSSAGMNTNPDARFQMPGKAPRRFGLVAKPTVGRKSGPGHRAPRSPSRKPEAGSRKPEAGSRKPEAGSREKISVSMAQDKIFLADASPVRRSRRSFVSSSLGARRPSGGSRDSAPADVAILTPGLISSGLRLHA